MPERCKDTIRKRLQTRLQLRQQQQAEEAASQASQAGSDDEEPVADEEPVEDPPQAESDEAEAAAEVEEQPEQEQHDDGSDDDDDDDDEEDSSEEESSEDEEEEPIVEVEEDEDEDEEVAGIVGHVPPPQDQEPADAAQVHQVVLQPPPALQRPPTPIQPGEDWAVLSGSKAVSILRVPYESKTGMGIMLNEQAQAIMDVVVRNKTSDRFNFSELTNKTGKFYAVSTAIELRKMRKNKGKKRGGTEPERIAFTKVIKIGIKEISDALGFGPPDIQNREVNTLFDIWKGFNNEDPRVKFNRKLSLIALDFFRGRLGIRPFFGDQMQIAVYAVKFHLTRVINEFRDPNSSTTQKVLNNVDHFQWTLPAIFALNDYLKARDLTPIPLTNKAAQMPAVKDEWEQNTKTVWIGTAPAKVEARPFVRNEMIRFARDVLNVDLAPPDWTEQRPAGSEAPPKRARFSLNY